MAQFNAPPPIPTPDGRVPLSPTPVAPRGEWKDAPRIIKGWAYPLTWLAIIVLPLLIIFFLTVYDGPSIETFTRVALLTILFCFNIWLNHALKKGARAAWAAQIILSVLGLVSFPVGTLIHGYILSQWFKPETRAWFGLN